MSARVWEIRCFLLLTLCWTTHMHTTRNTTGNWSKDVRDVPVKTLEAFPVVDVFVRTYRADLYWFTHLFSSIERFGKKVLRQVLLAFPKKDTQAFKLLTRNSAIPVHLIPINEVFPGYWQQIYDKLMVDTYTDAQFVLHLDADSLVRRSIEVADLFCIDERGFHPITRPVKYSASLSLRWSEKAHIMLHVPTMQASFTNDGQIFPRWIYAELRQEIQKVHHTNLLTYTKQATAHGKGNLVEYQALGSLLLTRHKEVMCWLWEDKPNTNCSRHGQSSCSRDTVVDPMLERMQSREGYRKWMHLYESCLFRARNKEERLQCVKYRDSVIANMDYFVRPKMPATKRIPLNWAKPKKT
mmetsp:Transcript_60495/g.107876  ORF Transcript_60495/g.107876 Transcript_60495/m.107876 type:complete len:354 (-) Transcript_60495:148-1209(-)